jgi:hypothetical protein
MTNDERADGIDRQIVDPLRRASVRLDDVHAARLSAGIEAALDRVVTRPPRQGWRAARVALISLGVGAAAAIAVIVARHAGPPDVVGAARSVPAVAREPSLLAPYFYSGAGADEQTLEVTRRLVARADARVRATIGTRVRLTLVGPGELTIEPTSEDGSTELVLECGRLFVDYDGRGGGPLRVRSPGAVTTVVGTLFSVEVVDKSTRVAVTRGRVRTESAGVVYTIMAGAAWSEGEGALDHVPAGVAAALAEHDASSPPPVGEYGIVRVDGPPPGAETRAAALDGRMLAGLPLVARVPAGSHRLDVAGGQLKLDVAGGNTIRIDRGSELWKARAPASRPPEEDGHAKASLSPRRMSTPPSSREIAAATAGPGSDAEGVEAVYLAAEAAMRSGQFEKARRELETVVVRDGRGARGQAALLDLARLALAAGGAQEARRYLTRLHDQGSAAGLAEAAQHLLCQLEVKLGDDAEATACLLGFRRRFPKSPHDAESLAALASVARTCPAAQPLLEEYLRVYPHGPYVRDAKLRLDACGASRVGP